MKDNYTFPVVFDYSDDEWIQIIFPCFDYQCTEVEKGEDPVTEAQDWLALNIVDCEQNRTNVPSEQLPDDFVLEQNQRLVYVNIWMPFHRSSIKVTYTKKTLTIPTWLDILAKQNNVNFSELLTQALKEKLNLQDEGK